VLKQDAAPGKCMGIFKRYAIQFILLFSIFSGISPSSYSNTLALNTVDQQRVVAIPATNLEPAQGKPIKSLSLLAMNNGILKPVPFQFDEMDVEGFVYFKSSNVDLKGIASLFDRDDSLLFMLSDAGEEKPDNLNTDGLLLAEIKLLSSNGKHKYAYLIENSILRSDINYVRYSKKIGRVETDQYTLQVDPDNAMNWIQFRWDEYSGINVGDPLDTMKIRVSAGVGTPFTRMTIGNKEMIAEPIESKSGPIRAITAYKLTAIVLGIPFLSMNMQIKRTAFNITYDVRLIMPPLRRKLLFSPSLTLSLDGNQLYGTEIRTALGPKAPAIVDGELSPFEKKLIGTGVNNEKNWIWAHTGNDFDIVATLNIPHPELPVGFFIQDDDKKIDNPERYLGQLPNVGYIIKDLPDKGIFFIQVNLFFSNNLGGLDHEKYIQLINEPADYSVMPL